MDNLERNNRHRSPEFTKEEVINSNTKGKKGSSAGPVGIKNEILEESIPVIANVLKKLLNECFKERKFPVIWKEADMAMLLKGS